MNYSRPIADATIRHVYVHVPFCSSICTFCALYSVVHHDAPARAYVSALKREIAMSAESMSFCEPDTIYFGGGTPTQLSEGLFEEMLVNIANVLRPGNDVEWSCECAPDSLTPAKLACMQRAGLNRLSFGVQTFDDRVLKLLNRRHSAQDVDDALCMAREAGQERVGLDLIACLPGVSDRRWREDLAHSIRLAPEHMSVYGLTPEPGTVLARQIERGDVRLSNEKTYFNRLDYAESFLASAGLERYEISNYAISGRSCRHNMAYWTGRDYIGFGPGASSRVGLRRWTNTPDVKCYSDALAAGRAAPCEEEILAPEEDMAERAMFAIRTRDGLLLPDEDGPFAAMIGGWRRALESLESHGFVRRDRERWHLTYEGRWVADTVAATMVA